MNSSDTIPLKFTYPKKEHLKSRKAIEQLFKSGESFFIYPYKVIYQFTGQQSAVSSRQGDRPEEEKSGSLEDELVQASAGEKLGHPKELQLQDQPDQDASLPIDDSRFPMHDYRLSTADCRLKSGFAVSTKNFKHAVDRNRIKRLGREGYRLNKHALIQQLTDNHLAMEVFFIFTDKKLPDFKLIENKMQACMKKLIHLTKKHHEKLLQG